jgi:hypothetical protein
VCAYDGWVASVKPEEERERRRGSMLMGERIERERERDSE